MKFNQDSQGSAYFVHAYGPGEITVAGPGLPGADGKVERQVEIRTRSTVISANRMLEWAPQSYDTLKEEDFEVLATLEPELVVFGSGQTLRFPPHALLKRLIARRIGFEVMDTGAACRTYNILASEGRNVVAALLMI